MSKWIDKQLAKFISWLTGSKITSDEVTNAKEELRHFDNRRVEYTAPRDEMVRETIKTDQMKIEELFNIILDRFKDYKTNGTIENMVIKKVIIQLLENRQAKWDEADKEKEVLASDMNDLIANLKMLSESVPE